LLKASLKVAIGTFVAAAVAFFLAALGTFAVPSWTGDAAVGPNVLGRQLGPFLLVCLIGFSLLRGALRHRGSLLLYLLGGAVVGLLAAGAVSGLAGTDASSLPYVLAVGAIAGAAGGAVVSGTGRDRAVQPTPIDPA
jgi:hypothetical protein